MSKMMSLLFVVAGFVTQNVQAAQPIQPALKTNENEINALFAEKAKWNVLRLQLSEKLDGAQMFTNKVGSVMNTYASGWALVLGLVALMPNRYDSLPPFSMNMNNQNFSCGSSSSSSFGSSNIVLHKVFLRKSVTVSIFIGLITYSICKIGGARLEDKASQSLRALTDFVQQWDMHKIYTPMVLHELFNGYANDFKAHGKLTTVDKIGARRVVESILTLSVIAETIK